MSQRLLAPAGVTPGSVVVLTDGTTTIVAADGSVTVADGLERGLLNAAFTYDVAANTNTSQAASKGDSSTTASSAATSKVASISANESVAASKGDSSGTQASVADSKGVAVSVTASTLTSRRTSSAK